MLNTFFPGTQKTFQGDLYPQQLQSCSVEPKKELCAFAISCKNKSCLYLG